MAIRCGEPAITSIERYLGTSFDVVQSVANSLAELISVADNLDTILAVADDIVAAAELTNIYLGALDADPVVDNDGNALVEGAFYLNTVTNTIRYYNGTIWFDPMGDLNASFDAFYATYLGSYASAPTQDINGNPVVEGALYWNTTDSTMYAYIDGVWVTATYYSGTKQETIIATASQTVFNLSTITYIPNQNNLAVYRDGVRLFLTDDYSEVDLDTVLLVNPAVAGDKYVFVTNEVMALADVQTITSDLISYVSDAQTAAGSAAASASSAATIQTSIEAAWDAFDDRYLGAFNTDPLVDNDGAALTAGTLYFNTSVNLMKVYTGSLWDNVAVSTAGFELATSYTTTAVSKTLAVNEKCYVTAATQTLTLPPSPGAGDRVGVMVGNFTDTIVARNATGETLMTLTEDMTIDTADLSVDFVYLNGDWRLV